jgi:hypothetical protein
MVILQKMSTKNTKVTKNFKPRSHALRGNAVTVRRAGLLKNHNAGDACSFHFRAVRAFRGQQSRIVSD